MYYNSNRNSNDYYNAYKRELAELEASKNKENMQKVTKLILSLLVVGLFIITAYYLYQYLNPTTDMPNLAEQNKQINTINQKSPKVVIKGEASQSRQQLEELTTKSNVLKKEPPKIASNMNEKDIALIVQIIMSEMKGTNEIPLEKELKDISKKEFKTESLEYLNHYNKVVLKENPKRDKNHSLMELNQQLTSLVEENVKESAYTQAIKKEVIFRQNEMRIIIVQKGDTLSKIAKKAYGNHKEYRKIFSANPEIIKNPHQIFVGQRLRIPLEKS